ncbi:MAG: hypothetical protein MHPSP_001648 [Paramarteilia canceri]
MDKDTIVNKLHQQIQEIIDLLNNSDTIPDSAVLIINILDSISQKITSKPHQELGKLIIKNLLSNPDVLRNLNIADLSPEAQLTISKKLDFSIFLSHLLPDILPQSVIEKVNEYPQKTMLFDVLCERTRYTPSQSFLLIEKTYPAYKNACTFLRSLNLSPDSEKKLLILRKTFATKNNNKSLDKNILENGQCRDHNLVSNNLKGLVKKFDSKCNFNKEVQQIVSIKASDMPILKIENSEVNKKIILKTSQQTVKIYDTVNLLKSASTCEFISPRVLTFNYFDNQQLEIQQNNLIIYHKRDLNIINIDSADCNPSFFMANHDIEKAQLSGSNELSAELNKKLGSFKHQFANLEEYYLTITSKTSNVITVDLRYATNCNYIKSKSEFNIKSINYFPEVFTDELMMLTQSEHILTYSPKKFSLKSNPLPSCAKKCSTVTICGIEHKRVLSGCSIGCVKNFSLDDGNSGPSTMFSNFSPVTDLKTLEDGHIILSDFNGNLSVLK